jgi:hypothetical protein
MSEQPTDPDRAQDVDTADLDAEEYGSLTVEDEPGTVDPAGLAGTASPSDEQVGYEPEFSAHDEGSAEPE